MPVKNAGKYLAPCLDSILAQSFTDWELIAINDGSTDGSDMTLLSYAERHANIKTANSTGAGIVNALQKAYELSEGEYIHRMDADDLMPPNKLQVMLSALEEGALVTGKVSYFCDEREIGDGFAKYAAWLNRLMEFGDFWRDVYKECPVPSSGWMINRSDFDHIGGFNSPLMPEDYDISFRVLKYNLNVIRLQDVIHHWRDSEKRTSRNEKQYFPIAYIPIKVHYFLDLHHDSSRDVVLWGAGKKGKLLAKELIDRQVPFVWVTNNERKAGKDIYGIVLRNEETVSFRNVQLVLALSSPGEQKTLQAKLDSNLLTNNKDYFWFF